jgi:cytoskeletal protein RodZ
MGGQRAEDERDSAGVGLDEADARRGERFVGNEVAGGGAGVGARTAARTDTEAGPEAADAVPAAPTVPAAGSGPDSESAPTVPAAGSGPDSEAPAADMTTAPAPEAETVAADDAERLPSDLTDSQILGRRLALARQHAGLSLEEVVAATRIRPGMLREIEAGDFVHCGGDVYARGHVRAIAKAVGIDPEPLLIEHPPVVPMELPTRMRTRVVPKAEARPETPKAAEQPGESGESAASGRCSEPASNALPTSAARDNAARFAGRAPSRVIRPAAGGAALVPPGARAAKTGAATAGKGSGSVRPPQPARKDDPGKIERHPKSANWTAAMLVALLGLVVFAGVQLFGNDSSKTVVAAVPTTPAPKAAAVKPPPPPVRPVPKGVAVKIAAVGSDSWLYVTSANGKVLFDNLLPAGGTQSFQDAKQLGVTLGNAAAVHMTMNGKELASPGGTGEVVHVTLNPTGMVSG